MFVIANDRKSIINIQQTTSIYIGSDGCTVKVDFKNGKGCQIARYDTESYSKIALEMMADSVNRNKEIFTMPDAQTVRAKINLKKEKSRNINGKKTKGYGGS